MLHLIVLFASFLVRVQVAASPISSADPVCTTTVKRKAWQNMSSDEKASYIKAEQCIMSTSTKLTQLPGVRTRFDDLAGLHQINALLIHSTGTFLPWHRYFLHLHEYLLSTCGYTGGHPYWNEPADAGKFAKSSVFDKTLGMGGDGKGANNCVTDGPFANYTIMVGPGFASKERCLNRKLNDNLSSMTGQIYVDKCMKAANYTTALDCIYSGPHLMGHASIACMNGDSITSPGDPLFYLHHGFVDKMWADWQAMDSKRLTEIGGPNTQDPTVGFTEFPGSMDDEAKSMWGYPTAQMKALAPTGREGDNSNVVTLNHVLSSQGLLPNTTVGAVMDTKGGYLCYEYV